MLPANVLVIFELDSNQRTAIHYHPGFAEVNLGIYVGLIGQWYEDRLLPGAMLVHILPDSGLTVGIAMLLA